MKTNPEVCPWCGQKLTVRPETLTGDVPCRQCGRVLWFVRRTVGDAVILTFLPGSTVNSESLERVEKGE